MIYVVLFCNLNRLNNLRSKVLGLITNEISKPSESKVALNKTMGRKKEAAELLGWGRNTLTRKIKELGLDN